MEVVERLEKQIGYKFNNKALALEALTHTSYANEHRKNKKNQKISRSTKNNERLEFLGDSVLNLVITTYLFETLRGVSEGDMSRIRSTIVCEKSLRVSADGFDLSQFLLLGKGEELTGGRQRDSIIADAMEALIGAIYLDSDIKEANLFIMKYMKKIIAPAVEGKLFKDYKTQYQEIIQKKRDAKIEYHVVAEKGPDHNKVFTVQLSLDGRIISFGEGKNKKEAEQNAAREAMAVEYNE